MTAMRTVVFLNGEGFVEFFMICRICRYIAPACGSRVLFPLWSNRDARNQQLKYPSRVAAPLTGTCGPSGCGLYQFVFTHVTIVTCRLSGQDCTVVGEVSKIVRARASEE